MRRRIVCVAPARGVASLAAVILLGVLVGSLLAYAPAAGTQQAGVSARAPRVITDLQFVTVLPVGSDPQAIVATADRVFVSDHNDVNRELYAFNVGDWTLAGNWAQMAGNEGGAVFGNTVYFPDTFDDGDTQITRLIRIDASTLNITPILLNFSTISYSVCPGDLSTNNDMTLSADGNTAYVLWNRGIAVVDLSTNAQTSFFTLPEGVVCTDEIQYANGKLYISAFEAGGRLMVLDATTGADLGDVFPAGNLQPAGFDRSPDGGTVYFNDFYGPRVGRIDAATDTLGTFVDLPAGGNSFDLAADPTAGSPYVYVVREEGVRLEALNMVANTVENTVDTPWFTPRAVETSPDGRYVYIAGQNWDWPPQGFLAVFEVVEDGTPSTPTPTPTSTPTPTITSGSACPADVNGDGVVDGVDVQMVAAWWQRAGFPPEANVNGDGVVDIRDIMAVAGQWGQPCGAAPPTATATATATTETPAGNYDGYITFNRGLVLSQVIDQVQVGSGASIWIVDPDSPQATLIQVTPNESGSSLMPSWGPGYERIVFASNRGADVNADPTPLLDIWTISPDGSSLQRLTQNAGHNWTPAWSPDGALIAFASTRNVPADPDSVSNFDIFVMNADGSGQRFLADAGGQDEDPVFSADGQTVYFVAERPECYQIWQVPTAGGAASPLRDNANNVVCGEDISLSPDGNSLFFFRDGQLMEIDLTTGQVSGHSFDAIEPWIGSDGTRFTFISSDFDLTSGGDVMVSNLGGSNLLQVTSSGDAFFPRWSQPHLTPAENR